MGRISLADRMAVSRTAENSSTLLCATLGVNMKVKYKQCYLSKANSSSQLISQVSWIPVKYAVAGSILKLKENDVWEDGWVVMEVGPDILTEDEVPDSHKAIKVHRERTGDNLPKGKNSSK